MSQADWKTEQTLQLLATQRHFENFKSDLRALPDASVKELAGLFMLHLAPLRFNDLPSEAIPLWQQMLGRYFACDEFADADYDRVFATICRWSRTEAERFIVSTNAVIDGVQAGVDRTNDIDRKLRTKYDQCPGVG